MSPCAHSRCAAAEHSRGRRSRRARGCRSRVCGVRGARMRASQHRAAPSPLARTQYEDEACINGTSCLGRTDDDTSCGCRARWVFEPRDERAGKDYHAAFRTGMWLDHMRTVIEHLPEGVRAHARPRAVVPARYAVRVRALAHDRARQRVRSMTHADATHRRQRAVQPGLQRRVRAHAQRPRHDRQEGVWVWVCLCVS